MEKKNDKIKIKLSIFNLFYSYKLINYNLL